MSVLNQHIKQHYQQQNLTQEELQALIALDDDIKPPAESNPLRFNFPSKLLLACAVVVLSFTMALTALWPQQQFGEKVALEVVENHLKLETIEFSGDDFAQLNAKMVKLPFALVAPNTSALQNVQLVGGRYCSVDGQLAAQIRLINSDGKLLTLYQTNRNNQLQSITDQQYHLDGIKVSHWSQGSIFFSLAQADVNTPD